MIETTLIDWFGTLAGLIGVTIAVYLQLINPRKCHPGHVTAIFVAGAALIMIFSTAWTQNADAVAAMKIAAIVLFVTLEVLAGYYVWKASEAAPPAEVIMALFSGGRNGGHHG